MSDKAIRKQIEELEQKYIEVEKEYDLKLEEIDDQIQDLKSCVCPDCDGTGEKHYSTGYPDYVIDTCNTCFGTGSQRD